MSSGNWVIDNLNNALQTWNNKLAEIWQLVTQSPTEFKGGGIWNVIVDIHGALQAIGLALLVLFFVIGVVKTCGSFAEVKKHYRTCTNKHLLAFKPTGACLRKIAIFFRLVVILPTEKASNH